VSSPLCLLHVVPCLLLSSLLSVVVGRSSVPELLLSSRLLVGCLSLDEVWPPCYRLVLVCIVMSSSFKSFCVLSCNVRGLSDWDKCSVVRGSSIASTVIRTQPNHGQFIFRHSHSHGRSHCNHSNLTLFFTGSLTALSRVTVSVSHPILFSLSSSRFPFLKSGKGASVADSGFPSR